MTVYDRLRALLAEMPAAVLETRPEGSSIAATYRGIEMHLEVSPFIPPGKAYRIDSRILAARSRGGLTFLVATQDMEQLEGLGFSHGALLLALFDLSERDIAEKRGQGGAK